MTRCSYCNWPAEVKCRKHKQHICGRMYCIQLHRFGGGDCTYVDPAPAWKQHGLGLIAGFLVGLVILAAVAL